MWTGRCTEFPALTCLRVYEADGTPSYFCDVKEEQSSLDTLDPLDTDLMARLTESGTPAAG